MKIYLVGGAVRDKILGLPIKEKDWVVVGATVEEMLAQGYQQVGKEFPVFLHPKTREEYALARMERKTAPGYQGFSFDTAKTVSLEADLERRDLTINAMAYDPETEALIDPFGGQKDIKARVLRHVSLAFSEDPVRILRVGRFLARLHPLHFTVAEDTIALMQNMVAAGEVNALVAERVWKELERALSEPHPEKFFQVLELAHALPLLFPEISMENAGMEALIASRNLFSSALVRFATLLSTLSKEQISALCQRYRVPNAYRELAQLSSNHTAFFLQAEKIKAEDLLNTFYAIDIFRREDRFKAFLDVCTSIAASKNISFNPDKFLKLAQAAKAYDVQQLLAKGLTGIELAQQLKAKRLEKLIAAMS